MTHNDSHAVLTPWKPVPTLIPPQKQIYLEELAHKTKGAFNYVAGMRYDRQEAVGLLQSWGLPWTVVVAGALLFHEEKDLHAIPTEDRRQLLDHIRWARRYIECIEDEDLSPLLSLPYEDLGALLIATATYYVALEELARRKSKRSFNQHELSHIESIGTTLIQITKQVNLWLFKRDIEDLILQLRYAEQYEQSKAEYQQILERDEEKLNEFCQVASRYFQQMSQIPVRITYAPCGVEGFVRRRKSKQTLAGSQEKLLTAFDFVIFDVIVPAVQDCYVVFGLLSSLGFLQDSFIDRIANPKLNGSSYLAFRLILKKEPLFQQLSWFVADVYICQFQIATPIMHAVTNYGCLYTDCYQLYIDAAFQEMQERAAQEGLQTSAEGKIYTSIIESLKRGQAQKDAPITVYDKTLRPYALPKGATVLDFAYYMYNENLSGSVSAYVNDREVPLERLLDAGDIVDIKTSDEPQAHEYWVERKYVTTSRALRAIQKQRFYEHKGYKLLHQKLAYYRYKLTEDELSQELYDFVKQYYLGTVNTYLERLDENADLRYTPDWAAQQIMRQIRERNEQEIKPKWVVRFDAQSADKHIYYLPRMFCNICQPTYPRDGNIVGYVSHRVKTLVIHSAHCPRLIARDHKQRAPLYPLTWHQLPTFRVGLSVTAQDRRGLVFDICKQLRYYQCSLVSIHAEAVFKDAKLSLIIETNDMNEVLDLLQKIKKVDYIQDIDIDPLKTAPQVYEQLQQNQQQSLLVEERIEVKHAWEEAQIVGASRRPRLRNPFNIARPPGEKMFFGRTNEIKKLQRELCADEGGKAILLYGPRRSGKSSLCHHFLEHYTYPPYWYVHLSLQDIARQNETEILMQIAEEVCWTFKERFSQAPPDWQDFLVDDPQMRLKRVLQTCFKSIAGARLVLVLDEFGGTIEAYQKKMLDERFFTYWRNLMSTMPQLSLVCVLPTIPHSFLTSGQLASVFNFMEPQGMDFLDEESAQQLLVTPLQEQNIVIHPGTVRRILDLTGCNPYYLTLIGSQLIFQLNQDPDKCLLNDDDLKDVIDRLVKSHTKQNFYFYHDELHTEEKPIVKAIVDITQQTGQPAVSLKRIAARLQKPIETLRPHLKRLQEGLILREQGAQWSSKQPYYAFTIELVRLWMAQNGDFFSTADGI